MVLYRVYGKIEFTAPKIAKNVMPDDNDEKTCSPVQVLTVTAKFLIRQFYEALQRYC